MLEKSPRSGNTVEVTFRMPPVEGAVELYLCGDFNNWHTSGAPLTQEPDGSWVTRLILEAGKSYRFRYHDNQGRWHNDWDADAYVPNAFGSEDSVVDLAAPLRNTSAEQQAGPRGRGGKGPRHRRPGTATVSGRPGPGGPPGRNNGHGRGRSGGNGRGGGPRSGGSRGGSHGGGPGGSHGGSSGSGPGGKRPRGR